MAITSTLINSPLGRGGATPRRPYMEETHVLTHDAATLTYQLPAVYLKRISFAETAAAYTLNNSITPPIANLTFLNAPANGANTSVTLVGSIG